MPIRSSEILVPPNSWVSLSGATTFFADRCLVKSIRTSHILSPRCRLADLKWHQGPSSEGKGVQAHGRNPSIHLTAYRYDGNPRI